MSGFTSRVIRPYYPVNVSFYHSGGLLEAFVESAGYDTDTGWEYDDEESPTKIRLCPSICGTIQSDATG